MKAMTHRFAIGPVLMVATVVAACNAQGNSSLPAMLPAQSSKSDLGNAGPMPAASGMVRIFAPDRSSNTVTEYALSASGNASPRARIRGAATGLDAPFADGTDSAGQLYVLNASSITVYAQGAHGNATPKFKVTGGLTQISSPQGLAVDPTGKTYVTNQSGGPGYITAYAAGANGDRAPVQTIQDGASLLFIPAGIALHGSLLYVADPGDQSINEYSAAANGIVNPVTVISGLGSPSGIVVDAQGLIYVTDSDAVKVFAANAGGFATPLRTVSGSATQLHGPTGLTVHGSIMFVANSAANSLTEYPKTGNGDIVPFREISGSNTGLKTPEDVTVH